MECFFLLSTAPDPPAPDQSRHNMEAVRRKQRLEGKDIDKAGKKVVEETAQQTRLADDAGDKSARQTDREKRETSEDIHLYSCLSRAEFCQSACTLLLPFLLGYPHVVLVGDLERNVLVRFEMKCQKQRSRTRLASTAPPRNTMCLRRGGSSMRTLNFYARVSCGPGFSQLLNIRSVALGSRPERE